MKNGTYRVSFEVNLNSCKNKAHAKREVASMVTEMIENDDFPEVDFELTEAEDVEYNTEEDEVQELNF